MNPIPAMAKAIEIWPLDRLIQDNAITYSDDQVVRVAEFIKKFGFKIPILVDGKSGIIAGHCRLLAARKLGLTEAPVIILDHMRNMFDHIRNMKNQELLCIALEELSR